MEEKKIQEIFDALKNEALSERERSLMRSELQLLMKNHPLKVPLYLRAFDAFSLSLDSNGALHGRHAVAFALSLFLVVGVGTSFAAQNALPGDALYPMKIHINEQVQGALAVSDVAKVEWSTELTQRRLEEAEVLAAKGTLNDESSSAIASQIAASTNDFETHIAALAEKSDHEEAATDAQSDFDASLSAHEQLLAKLGNRIPNIRSALDPILSSVRARANERVAKGEAAPTTMMAMMATTEAPPSNARKTSSGDKDTAARRKQRAEKQLKEVRELASEAKTTIGSSSLMYFHGAASATAATISDGDRNADEGNFDKAIRSYQEAIRAAAEAKAGINAEMHLRQNVQLTNFDFNSDSDDGENEKGDAGPSGNIEIQVPHLR